jgi:lichenan operon transcriptional antiterminator
MADKTPQLLELLAAAGGWVPAAELADRLGVSTRTIRSYVTAIKAAAGTLDVVSSSTAGYRLNRDAYLEYASGARQSAAPPATPRERVAFLVTKLTQTGSGLDVHELATELFVSASTIESDLRRVRGLAREAGVELVRNGDLVRLDGREDALRRLISRIFREETARGLFDLRQVQDAFSIGDLSAFKTDVIALLESSGYAVNEFGLDGVLVHTAIAVERSRRRLIRSDDEGGSDGGELREPLASVVEQHFHESLPPGELSALAALLLTRVGTRQVSPETELLDSPDLAADVAVVRRLLQRAEREYLVELSDDEFLLRLTMHVRNLVVRARAGGVTHNPLTRSIKTSYPLTYELAVYLASEIQREYGITVRDDEIGFLALHIGSHLERHSRSADEVTVTLVAPGYHDLGAVLRERIESIGPELRVERLVSRTDADLEAIDSALIVTTLPGTYPDRVVVVRPFPTPADLDQVRAAAARIRRHTRRARIRDELLLYFDERAFFHNPQVADEGDTIRLLGRRMIDLGHIDEQYLAATLERESLSSTAFTESLAVPHAMAMTARRTAIALAVNDEPISWGDGRVNVVALIAFSSDGRAAFQTVFEQFVEVFSDRAGVQALLQDAADFPAFIESLARLIDA